MLPLIRNVKGGDMKITETEKAALLHASMAHEEPGSFPRGVGEQTLERLHKLGWLKHGTDKTYGKTGYKITEAGWHAIDFGRPQR